MNLTFFLNMSGFITIKPVHDSPLSGVTGVTVGIQHQSGKVLGWGQGINHPVVGVRTIYPAMPPKKGSYIQPLFHSIPTLPPAKLWDRRNCYIPSQRILTKTRQVTHVSEWFQLLDQIDFL